MPALPCPPAAKMEEVVLTVTRENCETLIGKNVRVIASDASKEVPKEVTRTDGSTCGKDRS